MWMGRMPYGAVERRHCEWQTTDDSQASAATQAEAATRFAHTSRHRAPLLLTGFATALDWSAVEDWPHPEYLGRLLDGIPGSFSGVKLSSTCRHPPAEERCRPLATAADGEHAGIARAAAVRTATFAPGQFAVANARKQNGEGDGRRKGAADKLDASIILEETCSWAEGIDRVFRRTDSCGTAAMRDVTDVVDTLEETTAETAEEERCCYMKSDMRPRLRADLANFPDAAFFPAAAAAPARRSKPPATEGFRDALAKVWVGQAGACTSLHFDLCHGLIAQVFGRKRVTLYPPSESASLSPFRACEGVVRCSQVDQLLVDAGCVTHAAAHPAAAAAQGVRVVVAAGEALYVPPFW